GAVALALAGAVLGILSLTRKTRPPLSPLFTSAPVIRELQGMVAEYPRDPKWHLGLGLAYHDDGHYLSAIDSLQTTLRLGAPEPLVRQTLALCYMKLDRPHEALRELQRVAELSPGNVFAQLRISEA